VSASKAKHLRLALQVLLRWLQRPQYTRVRNMKRQQIHNTVLLRVQCSSFFLELTRQRRCLTAHESAPRLVLSSCLKNFTQQTVVSAEAGCTIHSSRITYSFIASRLQAITPMTIQQTRTAVTDLKAEIFVCSSFSHMTINLPCPTEVYSIFRERPGRLDALSAAVGSSCHNREVNTPCYSHGRCQRT
jgi:hypothetical protein